MNTSGDSTPIPALRLPRSDDSGEISAFLEQAPNALEMWSNENCRLDGRMLSGRVFPNITKFSYLGCKTVADAEAFFNALPALRTVSFWTSPANEGIDAPALAALANSSCWTELDSLELHVSYRGVAFERLEGWEACWAGRKMALTALSLSGLSLEGIQSIWQAEFPKLVRLRANPALAEALLDQLLQFANLPQLELLDIRFNLISGEALKRFGARARERFPKLREIGIEFYTGEKDEDYDWNGGVVQSFDVQYRPEEITEMYLKGTGIEVVKLS